MMIRRSTCFAGERTTATRRPLRLALLLGRAAHSCWICVALVALAAAPALASDGELGQSSAVDRFIARHCLDCHTGDQAEADLPLDALPDDLQQPIAYQTWSQLYQRVADREMPPADADPPDDAERTAFLSALGNVLTAANDQRQQSEGRSPVRRLNRSEYQNTLRDLLALPQLEILEMLPAEGTVHGYDKSAAALDVSHVHITKWMEAADAALAQAVAPVARKPSSRVVRAELRGVDGVRRICQGLYSQLKQERVIPMVGMEIDPTLEADRGDFAKDNPGFVNDPPPHFDGLAMFINGDSNLAMELRPFRITIPGTYRIRVHGYGVNHQRGKMLPSERIETVGFYTDNRTLGYCDLPSYQPTTAELTVWLNAGDHIKPLVASSTYPVIRVGNPNGKDWQNQRGNGVVFQWFELEGPLYDSWPPESHRRLFGDLPLQPPRGAASTSARATANRGTAVRRAAANEVDVYSQQPQQDAQRLIETFVQRVLRRPVTPADVQLPLQIARRKLADGHSLQEALLAAYRSVLCSPDVLLLQEDVGPLDGHALASRLAYFLWASPPDAALRRLADSGDLLQPATLRQQVDRMLDDPRATRFVEHFVDHWLDLKDIQLTQPDENLYPEYNPLLLDSMLAETRGYFEQLIRDNLPIEYVVASDFSMLNQRLAELYAIDGVQGVHTRRVPLPAASHRGGFLTQASVLKVTANGTVTSPVVRGTFVLTKLLGDPPPPPPPVVPAVEPDLSGATTIRQQLAQHRADPSCAACHAKIDPPGFALECFDVMGAYRQRYRSLEKGDVIKDLFARGGKLAGVRLALPVDPSGELAGGGTFDDVDQFRQLLLQRQPQLADNLLRQFIVYATGTPPGFADQAEVDAMLASLAGDGYPLRSMIHAVVQSRMFRHK